MDSSPSTPKSSEPITIMGEYPFDNRYGDADVILRSSDGIAFFVHKAILRVASTFFAGMFSLPQPVSTSGQIFNLHTIDIDEGKRTIDSLLRLCYPVTDPSLPSVHDIEPVLGAAIKYDMNEATRLVTTSLLALLTQEPLQVYAAACRLNLESTAYRAASTFSGCSGDRSPGSTQKSTSHKKMTSVNTRLSFPVDAYDLEMDTVSAGEYYRLLCYRSGNAQRRLHFWEKTEAFLRKLTPTPAETSPREFDHPFNDSLKGDIIIRSCSNTYFYVYKQLLSLASSVLAELIQDSGVGGQGEEDLPAVLLPESDSTLAVLLQLCYPLVDPVIHTLWDAHNLLEAATKYKIVRAVEVARKRWFKGIYEEPMRVFLRATRLGWEKETTEAAMQIAYSKVKNDITDPGIVFEMDRTPAFALRRLLVFRQKCREAIALTRGSKLPRETLSSLYWDSQASNVLVPNTAASKFLLRVHQYAYEKTQVLRENEKLVLNIDQFLPFSITPPTNNEEASSALHDEIVERDRTFITNIAYALAKIKF
ncbi:uncharacterized protein FIBRA_03740 [Fibroporia radiculosa]|uniref:BTB domain-containing protein n=1 Tax=Fibroporia radiculosa TaxID=599839 RepID=J4I9S6_9APHY|nr:uncharacterized protein FIBRA_03740 [Fibroporia radiculosa]CCM01676.1 predicted protein [Fibroporia radiculosa]